MTEVIAEELATRFAARHAALRQMGQLHDKSMREPAWWHYATEHRTDVRWMFAAAQYGDRDQQRVGQRLRGGAEALALLNTLARVDFATFVREVKCVRPSRRPRVQETVRHNRSCWEIGFSYRIYAANDIPPVCHRILGVDIPSEAFIDDYAWLKATFPSVKEKMRPRPIPVRILVCLARGDAADLESVLHDVVQSINARRLLRDSGDLRAQAAESARFDIVEVDLGEQTSTLVNIEALECLAKLTQLGVRVPHLSAINLEDTASQDPKPLLKVLQALMPPRVESTSLSLSASSRQVKSVHTNEVISSRFLPAIFSAIQESRGIESVRLDVHYDPADVDDGLDSEAAMTLWRWAAYTLFSRHACASLENLVVDVTYVDHDMLNAATRILQADNPLAALLDTTFEDNQWVVASRFVLRDLETDACGDESSLFITQEPLRVRVVDRLELDGSTWWRVILPGYGVARVRAADATEPSEVEAPRHSMRPLHLTFPEVYQYNIGDILTLLRLVPREAVSIEIEGGEHEEDAFDMTEWSVEVLRLFRGLERLQFTCLAEIQRLALFVEAAEAGDARLRSLSLKQTFYPDANDILEFLAVLSDNNHPFTRQLEELDLTVCVREETPFEVFELVWRRMLQQNCTLHTVSLLLFASQRVGENDDEDPAFYRCRPLPMESKIAFLSAVHPIKCSRSTRGRVDTGVLSTIFALAAQPRTVTICFDEI